MVRIQHINNTAATVIENKDGTLVLFSYNTPVACYLPHPCGELSAGWYRTSKKWSRTTSKHINAWVPRDAMAIDQHILDSLGG